MLYNSLKKSKKILPRLRGKRNLLASILIQGILAAALGIGISTCEGMTGITEDINNGTSVTDSSLTLTLNKLSPSSVSYTPGESPSVVLTTAASLAGGSGKVKLVWYKIGGNPDGKDKAVQTDPSVDPASPVSYIVPDADLDTMVLGQTSYYYVEAYFPAAGTLYRKSVSTTAAVSMGTPSLELIPSEITALYATYHEGDENKPELSVSADLSGTSSSGTAGKLRFEWYKIGGNPDGSDKLVQTNDEVAQGAYVYYYPPVDVPGQSSYYVIVRYLDPSTGEPAPGVRSMAGTAIVEIKPVIDTDNDGYPDFWEIEHEGENDGKGMPYDPYKQNYPLGIDLSKYGSAPPGIEPGTNDWTGEDVCIVSGTDSVTEYRLFYSDNNTQPLKSITIERDPALVDPDNHVMTITVSDDVHELTVYTMGPSGANLIIEKRDDGLPTEITLYNANLQGGTPIDMKPDAKLKLYLAGTNTLTAGSVYPSEEAGWIASAGLHVPEGAELEILSTNKLEFAHDSCVLNAAGGTGTATKDDDADNSFGAGAGIGGGYGEDGGAAAGKITISGGTVYATGGAGKAADGSLLSKAWGGAAGIGGGGDLASLSGSTGGHGNGGTILIQGGWTYAYGGGGHYEGQPGSQTYVPGTGGAGIGGGDYAPNDSFSFTIIGGDDSVVQESYGGANGAGIGGGNGGSGGTILISGGTVQYRTGATGGGAKGGDNAAGIGGGNDGAGGNITISGGQGRATKGTSATYSVGGTTGEVSFNFWNQTQESWPEDDTFTWPQ